MFINILGAPAHSVPVRFEGREITVRDGASVAAALLEAGVTDFRRTPVSGAPRGPFCMMGVCFDCLLVIDGMPNQQGCMIPVRAGMSIARQSGAADLLDPGAGP